MSNKIKTYKGVSKDLTAHGGFKYEPGKEYTCDGKIEACANGFHGCERPLDVFSYFAPGDGSRYFEAEQYGDLDREVSDSKVASRAIRLGAEIGIPGLVKAQIEYVKAHTTTEHTDHKQATAGSYGAATAGDRGAATAGDRGAATAGACGAATAGYSGAATAGSYGAATAGDRGAATARGSVSVGKEGCGLVRGNSVKARGGVGAILVICIEADDNNAIKEWKAGVVDGETLKPDVWYTLSNGEFVEV